MTRQVFETDQAISSASPETLTSREAIYWSSQSNTWIQHGVEMILMTMIRTKKAFADYNTESVSL